MTSPSTASVLRGNATAIPLASASVDLIVTSPPYFALRSYQDGGEHYAGQIGSEPSPAEFLEALWAVMEECWRVLKPSGSCWVNLGDKWNSRKSLMGMPWRFAIGCTDDNGSAGGQWILREEVIWEKPNALPQSVRDRTARKHEQWFHLTKESRYFANIDLIREKTGREANPEEYAKFKGTWTPEQDKSGADRDKLGMMATSAKRVSLTHPLGKLPGSVWSIPSEPLRGVPEELGSHFAAFPSEWPRRLILGWCPPGGVVLDPFGGTGTTAAVAAALGRQGISLDLSADYCALAAWRTQEPKLRAKVRARSGLTDGPVQLEL